MWNNKDVQVVPTLAKRRLAQTVQNHNYINLKKCLLKRFSSILNINRIISSLDVIPNFIQTVEIEAILESKRILVYTLLINKSSNGVIYIKGQLSVNSTFGLHSASLWDSPFSPPWVLEWGCSCQAIFSDHQMINCPSFADCSHG